MDGRTMKPAGNCRPRKARKKDVQSVVFTFYALGSQNKRIRAGKTHMIWAHLTQRRDPRVNFFISPPPLYIIFFRVLRKTATKTIASDFDKKKGTRKINRHTEESSKAGESLHFGCGPPDHAPVQLTNSRHPPEVCLRPWGLGHIKNPCPLSPGSLLYSSLGQSRTI